jgi:D-alanyl-D-alanine carboxypeptidase/D-alanyl-D-alanine-endopeptidase (penicillin-binding protein 4)
MDTTQLLQADGSGLSRRNYVSPRCLVTLLTYLRKQSYGSLLYDSLPIAGVDGTLRNRMKGTPAENNCRAKTGTLGHVTALSGYVTTRDGETLVFSLLMNNHLGPNSDGTAVQNKIVTLLAGYKKKDNRQD